MDDNDLPIRMIRSASISALIRVMDAVLGRIAQLHTQGEHREASDRLAFVEGLLLHCLSMVSAMKTKVDAAADAPITEADADAFAEQLASMPEVAEPPHG
jgi:hypothetical protein